MMGNGRRKIDRCTVCGMISHAPANPSIVTWVDPFEDVFPFCSNLLVRRTRTCIYPVLDSEGVCQIDGRGVN